MAGDRTLIGRLLKRELRMAFDPGRRVTAVSVALAAMWASFLLVAPSAHATNCTTYGSYSVCGAIRDKYLALGGPSGTLGNPTTNELYLSGGAYSIFQQGSIYWSSSTGAHMVRGAIKSKWQQWGAEYGALGYPTTDELPLSGGAYSIFQQGSIYWSPSTDAHMIRGAVKVKWDQLGSEYGLGYPTTDEEGTADGEGKYNDFSSQGSVFWRPGSNAYAVVGAVRDRWASGGRELGCLGYPTSDEYSGRSNFQSGYIQWNSSSGTTSLSCTLDTMMPSTRYTSACQQGTNSGPCQTDNESVTFFIEASLGAAQQNAVLQAIYNNYQATDLNFTAVGTPVYTGDSETDVVYRQASPANAYGRYFCDDDNASRSAYSCDQGYVEVVASRTDSQIFCHETGHAVGLTHGGDASPSGISEYDARIGCLTNGGAYNFLSPFEVAEINTTY